eukprot:6152479-Alexandrium_andersonii.AAC.1
MLEPKRDGIQASTYIPRVMPCMQPPVLELAMYILRVDNILRGEETPWTCKRGLASMRVCMRKSIIVLPIALCSDPGKHTSSCLGDGAI